MNILLLLQPVKTSKMSAIALSGENPLPSVVEAAEYCWSITKLSVRTLREYQWGNFSSNVHWRNGSFLSFSISVVIAVDDVMTVFSVFCYIFSRYSYILSLYVEFSLIANKYKNEVFTFCYTTLYFEKFSSCFYFFDGRDLFVLTVMCSC